MILLFSTIFISLALVFYTTGIWAERLGRYLKQWHIYMFWLGFTFDVAGTALMHNISDDPFNFLDLHTLTGQIALWLMLVHAIWATLVVKHQNEAVRIKFHKYSILVWLIWLIPYFGGMFMGMSAH